jgi:DNA repair exonuclease SbcCD ATPase subunit
MGTPEGKDTATFAVRNIGGISRTEVEIPPGVTVLTGKNATNRTSFLQSIRAALGSTAATLKGDAESGHVTMELEGETYERVLERVGDDVTFTGTAYLDDAAVADQFAFLLETNEARQSVARGDDLREQIMEPVDTTAIRADIQRLEREKAELDEEISAIEDRKRDLPELEQQREAIREEITTKRETLAQKEAEIDDIDVEKHREDRTDFEETLTELRETRAELESVRADITSQSESLRSLRDERADIEAELADLPDEPAAERAALDEEIQSLRDRRQSLDATISELQSIIQYNQDRLDEESPGLLLREETPTEAVTDRLTTAAESSVVCWTCGSTVGREQIATTIQQLRNLREERVSELEAVKSALTESKSDKESLERTQRRRTELEEKLADIDSEQNRRESQIASLKTRREALTDDIAELEERVESLESEEFEAVLSMHREANQLEFELDSLESELESVTAEIEEIEAALQRAEELCEQRTALTEELTEKRTEIKQIEADAVAQFNEHMSSILDILQYRNVERIWIERRHVGDGAVDSSTFELHVVRSTENGAAYEDTIDHLSESEREVTGLIFALAGYLVHDLHETVPFMLLDSLEAIDADRIAKLVEYLADYAPYLVVALLPEDAQALDESYTRIRSI